MFSVFRLRVLQRDVEGLCEDDEDALYDACYAMRLLPTDMRAPGSEVASKVNRKKGESESYFRIESCTVLRNLRICLAAGTATKNGLQRVIWSTNVQEVINKKLVSTAVSSFVELRSLWKDDMLNIRRLYSMYPTRSSSLHARWQALLACNFKMQSKSRQRHP